MSGQPWSEEVCAPKACGSGPSRRKNISIHLSQVWLCPPGTTNRWGVSVWTSHTLLAQVCFNVKRVDFTRFKKTRKSKARNCVGPRVREARLKGDPPISQDDLAGRLAAKGVSLDRSAISRIESQERYVMDYEAAALADCLKVSVSWLFSGA